MAKKTDPETRRLWADRLKRALVEHEQQREAEEAVGERIEDPEEELLKSGSGSHPLA